MKVAVIGTGNLGPSIAQVFSQCSKIEKVYLCKGRETSVDGRAKIEKAFDKQIVKGKLNKEEAALYLSKIIAGEKGMAANADFIVEAVSEDIDIKRKLFQELDKLCDPHVVFTSNTSSLSIGLIGDGLSRPLVGMHFFNPATAMKLVEVIGTERTPKEYISSVMDVARDIGKTPVEVQEAPGFIVNRILIPMINEAISVYSEGVASAEDIDIAMKLGANHPMGPLALADLIGLDVVLAILNILQKETGDSKYIPQPMLKKMVREHKLGKKTGEGFYRYE